MTGTDKEGCVRSLSQLLLSYYLLNTLYFNFLSWYIGLEKQREFLPPTSFFSPEVEVLLMLSGPTEYIYFV